MIFFAMYTTTKIKGIAADWKTMSLSNGGERESMLQHFVSAGKILAKFHRVDIEGKKYGINAAQSPLYSIGTEIESIGKLRDSELNVRLALADEYFQANKVGGLVHGNFLDDVMMINDKGDITGIIDFNMTHYDYNIMIDFLYIPEVGIDHFIQGYEKESGMKIDPLMLPLTKISCLVASINKYWENKSVRDNKLYLLKGYLKQLGDEFSLNMGGKLRSYLANC